MKSIDSIKDMNGLKMLVGKEIGCIVDNGITARNIGVLGELVDIYKDITNVEYWTSKIGSNGTSSATSSSASGIHDNPYMSIGEVMKFNERIRSGNADGVMLDKLNKAVDELLYIASDIRTGLHGVNMDVERKRKFDTIFKV